jgi:hypothetical protein
MDFTILKMMNVLLINKNFRDMKYFDQASPPSVPGTVLPSQYSWGVIYNFFKTARVDRRKKFISELNYSLTLVI